MLIFVKMTAAMLPRIFRLLCIPFLILPAIPAVAQAGLTPPAFQELPLGAIRPQGWLQEQLQRQASGLTGHLDEVYPEVMGPSNAWLGGDGDAWERGLYWIDGLLPLAYILDDAALKTKAQAWVEAILASQREDGYFGPAEDHPYVYGLQRGKTHDWWPKMVALKILKQYYMATGDGRVIDCLTRYFRYQASQLDATPLDHWSDWGQWRGADNLEVVWWLYERTGEPSLLALGEKLHAQTTDWTALFNAGEIFTHQGSVHGVNLAQGFKAPVVWWQYSHADEDLQAPKKAAEVIRHTVGLPTGLWAADEQLHYGNPTRGSELCTAVEMLFSLEEMLRISGDPFYADWLERIAYNALPAQVNDDFTAKQYYQQVNQIACTRQTRPFSTPHDGTDTMFGTLNGYPCCLSNLHQGWPKFVQNLWYATDDGGLAALIYGPCAVTKKIGGIDVTVTEETLYPFQEAVSFRISFPKGRKKKPAQVSFPLYFRVPAWATDITLQVGSETLEVTPQDGILRIERDWRSGETVRLSFGAAVAFESWYDGSVSVVRGPLLYALPLEETWEWVPFSGRDRWFGAGAWQVTSDSPWNYCLLRDTDPARSVVSDGVAGAFPWRSAPIALILPARRLPDWKAYNGNVGEVAYWTEDTMDFSAEEEWIRLVPYGCTALRIAAFPTRIIPWDLELRETY